MASLEFDHVEKVYPGGTRAIADLSLRVADGELLALVGPSGCGKSTLLRLVAGLEQATRGSLAIGERVADALSPRERNVAMVFQDYALYPHKTVRGNLEFPLRMRGLPRAEIRRRVDWAAGLLDMGSLLERLPRQLSGGQRQRVAMGRALVREPSVFLLDEPLSNLDPQLRAGVRAEIADLQRRTRTTMLYVTHDQAEAMTLGERVAVLRGGRLLQVAPPRELYERPADVFVAGFLGSPPMNLFPARLARTAHGALALAIGDDLVALPAELAARAAATSEPGGPPATAGLRPEALRLADAGDAASATGEHPAHGVVQASVERVEWLGHETLAHLRVDALASHASTPLVARLPGMQPLERGRSLRLHFPSAAIHLFAADGRALPSSAVGPSTTPAGAGRGDAS